MASIAEALTELGITEWVLRGEPTTEAEFNEMVPLVRFVIPLFLINSGK